MSNDVSSDQLISHLNTQQREAVTSTQSNVLVLAGAGSGKTTVLTHRIAWLCQVYGISLSEIMAVTFTNKAAQQMRSRVEKLLGQSTMGLWIGTFHSLCHRLLRIHADQAGLHPKFNIIDQEDQRQLIKRLLKQLNLDDKLYPPRKLQGFINRKKEQGLRSTALKDETETNDPTLIHIYKVYEAQLQADQSLDFADLLLYTYELFKANERIRTAYQERFKMLLVDEFQDTNHLQYEWLKLLINDANTITAVGDDDQSIYGWRGANVEHVFEFQKDYAPVKIIKLEQNYRSTQNILNAANGLIAHNQKRMSKSLWSDRGTGEKINLYEASTEREEAHYLASCIQMNLANGYTADDMAILYRSNAQSRIIEETLLKYNIPYRIYGGVRFFERAEIKNALAYLRLIAFRDDNVAFERIINLPSRGIGQKTIEKIRTHARTYGMALFESAYEMVNKRILPAKSLKSVTSFLNLIDDLETRINNVDLAEKVRFTIEHSGLLAYYGSEKHDKARQRLENLKELVNAAYDFMPPIEKPNERHMLEEFLAFAVLESGEIQADKNTPAVHLMTIHAAKGLEFPFVYMVGLEENIFPTSQSIAENDKLNEERRLCYVGMTRAMAHLTLSYAHLRFQYGEQSFQCQSRFVNEIPQHLIHKVKMNNRIDRFNTSQKQSGFGFSDSSFWDLSTNKGLASSKHLHNERSEAYALGDNVSHHRFGQGVIVKCEGSGADLKYHIDFASGIGRKVLKAKYIKLNT